MIKDKLLKCIRGYVPSDWLNLISWKDKEPKYDIRDWDLEHKKIGKGVLPRHWFKNGTHKVIK